MTPLTEEQKKYALKNAVTVRMERIVIFKVTRRLDGVEYTEEVRSDEMKAIGANGGPRLYTPENEREMVRAYSAGSSLAAVGKQWGCSPQTVGLVCHKFGVAMRPQGARRRANGDDRPVDQKSLNALRELNEP